LSTYQKLSHLLLKLRNRRRPIAGHVVTVYRGSPIKGSGDFQEKK